LYFACSELRKGDLDNAPSPDLLGTIAAGSPNACDATHIACDAVHIRVEYFLGSSRLFDFIENSAPAAAGEGPARPLGRIGHAV
jgi:hypothetical protein